MNRFRSGKSLSPLRQAEAYWQALRTGAELPRRTQIDPRGLENILEYTFILERIAPGIARFRLAGSHLTDLAGMDVRGMPLTCFFTPAGRNKVSAVLEHVFDTPAVAELTLGGEVKRHQPRPDARMILLPLQSDLGDINRALGVLIADKPTVQPPQRFDVADLTLRPATRLQPVHQPHREPVAGFAEDQHPLQGRAPHLKLVQ